MKFRTVWSSESLRKKYWEIKENDKSVFKKLKKLYKAICQSPYSGEGHPHPLKNNYSGWWSRHITGPDVLVYRVDIKNSLLYIKELKVDYHKSSALSASEDPYAFMDDLFHENNLL